MQAETGIGDMKAFPAVIEMGGRGVKPLGQLRQSTAGLGRNRPNSLDKIKLERGIIPA